MTELLSGTGPIRRGFLDVAGGQIHYRSAGTGPLLLLCHASPGSSKQLEPLIARLARHYRVIAPDTPGNGDSSPLRHEAPAAGDFAAVLLAFLAALGVDRIDAYGSHTGAAIVAEMAILDPPRIGRLMLDGMTVFTAAERADMLARYADPFPADLDGAFLMRIFMFCRDQALFFPWYARDPAHRRDGGLPPAEALRDLMIEVLKASETYHHGYRAAFAYDAAARAPRISQPTLALAALDDPLRAGTEAAARALQQGRYQELPRFADPLFMDRLVEAIIAFVDG